MYIIKQKVTPHKRSKPGKKIKTVKVIGYKRKERPKGKKTFISNKSVRLYPIRDEYGKWHGFSIKKGKKSYSSSPLNFGIPVNNQEFRLWHKFKDKEEAKKRIQAIGDTNRYEFKVEDDGQVFTRLRKKNFGFTHLGISSKDKEAMKRRMDRRMTLARNLHNISLDIRTTIEGTKRSELEKKQKEIIDNLLDIDPVSLSVKKIENRHRRLGLYEKQ